VKQISELLPFIKFGFRHLQHNHYVLLTETDFSISGFSRGAGC